MKRVSIRVNVMEDNELVVYALTNVCPTKLKIGDMRVSILDNCLVRVETCIDAVGLWGVVKTDRLYPYLLSTIVTDERLTGDGYIYYKKVEYVYVDDDHDIRVTTKDENTSMFNIPVNLMFTAATTSKPEVDYISDIRPEDKSLIVKVIRNAGGIAVYPSVHNSIGAYLVNIITDTHTVNELPVRCIQYNHLMRLINNKAFRQTINNGNLLLAYADTYCFNIDADNIIINNPCHGVDTIEYDQFTGTDGQNEITVCKQDGFGRYADTYIAENLDSSFIELLSESIKHWFVVNK